VAQNASEAAVATVTVKVLNVFMFFIIYRSGLWTGCLVVLVIACNSLQQRTVWMPPRFFKSFFCYKRKRPDAFNGIGPVNVFKN
jgi:hypothetical protein